MASDTYVVIMLGALAGYAEGGTFAGKATNMTSPEQAVRAFVGGHYDVSPCETPPLDMQAFKVGKDRGIVITIRP